MNARITFVGNPWPEGHAAELRLQLRARVGEPGLDIQLETAGYSDEREVADDESVDGDWQAPIAWNNYHQASLEGWVPLPRALDSLAELDGMTLRTDHEKVGTEDWDWDDLAFDHCYILGHDAVAGHTLAFRREGTRLHVRWTGKVAMAYVGERAFAYDITLTGTLDLM
ncbi:MAG: hypothetical protein EP330_23005 [Deltaproteobacteria bacterium]|nr:MAG: hypothetical protein EP330_23005 [Deltaproteobacteria bacterium]